LCDSLKRAPFVVRSDNEISAQETVLILGAFLMLLNTGVDQERGRR
jgi:hypothetical protein